MPASLTSIVGLEGPFTELFKWLGHEEKRILSKVRLVRLYIVVELLAESSASECRSILL